MERRSRALAGTTGGMEAFIFFAAKKGSDIYCVRPSHEAIGLDFRLEMPISGDCPRLA